MINLHFHHQHPIRVYYEDTDFSGLVYHANYLRYLERGRTEWLRAQGVSQALLYRAGFAFVVSELRMKYHASALMDDTLQVKSRLAKYTPARMVFAQSITRPSPEGDTQTLITAEVVVSVINSARKPVRLSQWLQAMGQNSA
jgi:acyl-CoA thioester hydrolase